MRVSDLVHASRMFERSLSHAKQHASNTAYALHFLDNARAHVDSLPASLRTGFLAEVEEMAALVAKQAR